MSESRFTQEQQAVIDVQGRAIVSASAGSGKTTVMIEKIIRLIKSGCEIERILAVTFTKKAASQMKEKLCKALIETINAPETDKEKRQALKAQLASVPNADISTIHSFCSKLIRSYFFAASVDNTFRVIGGDDAEGRALKNEALDELLEEGYEQKDEDFSYLLSVYWRKKSDNALRKIFIDTYEELRCRADYKDYLLSCAYTEETFEKVCEDLFLQLKEKCSYYFSLVEAELQYFEDTDSNAQVSLANELMEGLSEILTASEYFSACKIEKPSYTRKKVLKSDSEEKRLHIERLAFLKEKISQIYDKELSQTQSKEEEKQAFLQSGKTARALAKYLLLFDEKYTKRKAEYGVLDYNDLEHKALELLNISTIAEEIKEKYRYVFVDEYQDVNPVQEAIISKLSGENLFLVGDVKQSIYGFRGSKSKFFVEKQREFSEGKGNNLAMKRNFRSSDKVLDAVNSQFSLAMTLQTCEVDYNTDSRMERGGRYALNDGRVQIYVLGEDGKSESQARGVYSVKAETGKKVDLESTSAKLIRGIIEKERQSSFFDAVKGIVRRVQYSDIAILSRKKQGQIAKTVAALSAEGVPVTAAAAVNVCDYAEVKTLIDILQLIDNQEQDVPLCSVLLSSLGNLTADDLATIRLAYKQETYFRVAVKKYAMEKEDVLSQKLREFFIYFENIRNLARVLDAGELLTTILSETRMEARLLAQENGVACLKRIHRFIEEAGAGEALCVHAFLERLRNLEYKIEYSENGGEDSVKVLTMHSSKGLEYPIVILDNLSEKFRGMDSEEVLVEEKYGLAPRCFDVDKMTKRSTLLRRLYEKKEEASSIADELNLYYVALTRAKYGLHMIFKERTVMPDVRYATSFAEFTDFSVWENYVVDETLFDIPKQERTALVFRPDETLVRSIMQAFLWEYPHAGIENLPVKSSATALLENGETARLYLGEEVQDNSVEMTADATEEKNTTGIEEGLAYHAFLEYFDFSALYNEDGSAIEKARLKELVEETYVAMKDKSALALLSTDKLVEILSNPVFYSLGGMRLYKEQKFLVALPVKDTYANRFDALDVWKNSDEEMIFQGAIDLLAVSEDEVRIIDYKYSKRNPKSICEHYRAQLELYRLAVAKIMKIPLEKVRTTIVNIYQGFEIEVD